MDDSETQQQMMKYITSTMDLVRKVLFKINSPLLLDIVFSAGKKMSRRLKK
jgi:hypothetical protein